MIILNFGNGVAFDPRVPCKDYILGTHCKENEKCLILKSTKVLDA